MVQKNETSKWEDILKNKVQTAFIAPCKQESKNEQFREAINETLNSINVLKRNGDEEKCFLGNPINLMKNEDDINKVKKEATIPENISTFKEVLQEVSIYLNGMFNVAHPKTMFNVVPPAAIPSIMGNLIGAMFNPNLVEQEYSGNVTALEIESGAIISKLIGYDPVKSAGHFTFGGTGCYLFATKLALTKCLGKESRFNGIREDAQILTSKVGHYAVKNCSDWTGIGMNNVRSIDLNEDSSMNLKHLEEVMEQCYAEGKPIAMIVATMGTTDAFAVDDIKGISDICDKFVKKHNLKRKPFIYADAVIGWAWSVFNSYDFKTNPMGFSKDTLCAIKECKDKIQYLYLADGIGIDFHKTGFTCYNCSMVCIKNKDDLELLTRDRDEMAYLYQFSAYTPGEYTLECSRSGSYALAAWCNLKYFGLEGFRTLLGNLIESENILRKVIYNEPSMVCVNNEDHGSVTLFRVYPKSLRKSIDGDNFAKEQYKREFEDKDYTEELKKYNEYQFKVCEELNKLLVKENGPALSFTSKFRLNANGVPVAAIKAYPMSPYAECSEEKLKENIIKYVIKASETVDENLEK